MSQFEDNPFGDPAIDNPFAVRLLSSMLGIFFSMLNYVVSRRMCSRIRQYNKSLEVQTMQQEASTIIIPSMDNRIQMRLR